MTPTPLQQKLLVACCGCAAVVAALLPGALSRDGVHAGAAPQQPAAQVLSVGASAHPVRVHHAPAAATSTAAPTSSSSAPEAVPSVTASTQSVTHRTVVLPRVSATPRGPAAIDHLHLTGATGTTMTLAWQASPDAASYRVRVDGVQVARVDSPSATVAWPDASTRVLVQVSAIDARGVDSELRAVVLVRPAAASAAPTASATATSTPSDPAQAASADTTPSAAVNASAPATAVNAAPPAANVDDAAGQLAGVGTHH